MKCSERAAPISHTSLYTDICTWIPKQATAFLGAMGEFAAEGYLNR